MTPKKELTRVVKTKDTGEVVQEFIEDPEPTTVHKPDLSSANVAIATPQATEREFIAQDTFTARPTDQAVVYELSLEFQNEVTGERRVVEISEPMTEPEAFAASSNYRQTGEILLQVIRNKRVGRSTFDSY